VAEVVARIAWLLAVLTLVTVVADITVTAQYRNLFSEDAVAVHGFPFVDLAVLGAAVLGALILTQDERHPIGRLLLVIGFTGALSLLTEAYSIWVVDERGPGPQGLAGAAGWVSTLLGGQLSIAAIALIFLLAPDGRMLSRRWRYAVAATALGAFLCAVSLLIQNPVDYDINARTDSIGLLAGILTSVGFLLISAGLLASVVSMVLRLRRSRGEARQQVRLIALAAALVAVGLVNLFVVQLVNGGAQTWAASLPLFIAYVLLIALFGIAVLRYRLYDVEVILNRTLVVVIGAAFAAIGYTTLVVLVGRRVGQGTDGVWLSLLATALVAVAFQPLRRQVIRLADRLAYGSRAKPYEALSSFSHRIAVAPSPETLLRAVADAAGRAVSAQGAAAVLHAPGAEVSSAVTGTADADADAHEVPVRHGREQLGSIRVWLRRGAQVHASDQRLLEALADQTAVVFRNVGLQGRLAAHVADLDRTTEELARSRSRIIEADDAARRTMEAAISRDVLPHLIAVPAGITRAREANAASLERTSLERTGLERTGLDDRVDATNTALEALRDLTRGLFPTQLARSGLEPSLRSHLARSGLGGALHVDPTVSGRRFVHPVEAAVYSCLVGAAREFAQLSAIDVSLVGHDLVVQLRGTEREDADLQAVLDRAEAVGGTMTSGPEGVLIHIPADAVAPVAT
jgi:hypothetical protein